MPQGNVRGVLGRVLACALMTCAFTVPNAAFAVNVPRSVIYDAANTDNDNLNHMYKLDDIKYDVYKDSACQETAKVGNTTVNAQLTLSYIAGADYAESSTVELTPGKYYVRENEASCTNKGIAWNPKVYEVEVTSNNTEANPAIVNGGPVTDPVVHVRADIGQKLDADTGRPQGDGSLEGCVVRVAYFDKILEGTPTQVGNRIGEAKRVWYFKTDADGKIDLDTAEPLHEGPGADWEGQGTWGASSDLYMANGKRVFLLGTYHISEVAAPKGYDLLDNAKVQTFRMDSNNLVADVAVGTVEYRSENTPNPGTIDIVKVDTEAVADGRGNIVQGDTNHAAIFTITNRSENMIKYYDQYEDDGDGHMRGVGSGTEVPVGGTVPMKLTCVRGSDGNWKSNTVMLPYGTYEITEDYGGEGMLTDRDWSETVSLHDQRAIEHINLTKDNKPVRAGLKLTKVDSDTVVPSWVYVGGDTTMAQLVEEIATGQGNAHLDGAEFTIKNVSGGPVRVDGEWYDSGADVATITTYVTRTTTGREIVVANTSSNESLPYGTYEVRETKAPVGYNPIVGLIGGAPVVVHPSEAEHGSWYFTGWDVGEV